MALRSPRAKKETSVQLNSKSNRLEKLPPKLQSALKGRRTRTNWTDDAGQPAIVHRLVYGLAVQSDSHNFGIGRAVLPHDVSFITIIQITTSIFSNSGQL